MCLHFIYQLRSPVTKEIKYVGLTKNINQRFGQHKWGKESDSVEKTEWINELKQNKITPLIEVIDIAKTKKEGLILEKQYIINYIKNGEKLFNKEVHFLKQFNEKGDLISSFNNIREAKLKTGICIKTRRGLNAGYLFTYGDFNENVFARIKNNRKVNCKKVIQKTKNGDFVKEFEGVREAYRMTGIDHRSISQVAAGSKIRKSAGGYIWEYIKQK